MEQELFLAMGGMAWAFSVVPKGSAPLATDSLKTAPECTVCSERQVSGGRGGRHGKENLDYTSLLIAKPVEFSGEFDLRIRSREKGIQVVENALEAIREEGKEVFDGMGLVEEENTSGENTCMELVIEREELTSSYSEKVGMIESRDVDVADQIEGWREKIEKRGELEFSPIKFEIKKVVSDAESLVLLNECWGKNN